MQENFMGKQGLVITKNYEVTGNNNQNDKPIAYCYL